jgi:peroxiredoxin
MSLTKELEDTYAEFQKNAPQAVLETFGSGVQSLSDTFDPSKVIQIGQKFPDFELQDATGKAVNRDSLLKEGALLVSFYRGEWCPFCNLELRALQKHLSEFKTKGVSLVAISPQLADGSLSTAEKNKLEFSVLSDVGNKLARQLGIVWTQPDSFRPIYEGFQIDWKKSYGDDSLEVPIPATILVDKDGVVRNTFIDPAYTKRLEPEIALEWAAKL